MLKCERVGGQYQKYCEMLTFVASIVGESSPHTLSMRGELRGSSAVSVEPIQSEMRRPIARAGESKLIGQKGYTSCNEANDVEL